MDRGSSDTSPGEMTTGSKDLLGERNTRPLGVNGVSMDGTRLDSSESPVSEGKLSNESARPDKTDAMAPSLIMEPTSSSIRSSGGLINTSIGLRLPLKDEDRLNSFLNSSLSSFSETCDRGTMESTVIRGCCLIARCRRLPRLDGGGMVVTARSAATDGGIASSDCTSPPRREAVEEDRRLVLSWFLW
jgi:hypothetical protein